MKNTFFPTSLRCVVFAAWALGGALPSPVTRPAGAMPAEPRTQLDFTRDIRPILSDKCFQCHGPDPHHRQADLRFDVEAGAKRDLGGYFAIAPARPEASALVERITTDDPAERMPPPASGKELTDDEVDRLRRWIREGAEWSDHWAYVSPRRHSTPRSERSDWALHWIDRFILARLEREGLAPSPEADRTTLLRRLSFDLTGLPPAPAAVAAFQGDGSPGAYDRAVDRLLSSPHFGERLAIYWLDLVRYADTVGYHGDQDHSISPYRDYVIDAFNRNLPFDLFTREQLAGDLLPGAGPEQKIASGYNRLLQTSHEGGVQAKEYLAIYAADRIRNLSAVWLGGTLGCAQCHDHKYDPYTQKDFYSMVAFFADIDEAQHFKLGSNALPTRRPPEMAVLTEREQERLAALEGRIRRLERNLAGAADAPPGENGEALAQKLAAVKKERDDLNRQARRTMITVAIEPRTIRVLPRGNWLDDSGPVVQPAVPEFLGTLRHDGERADRLDLARWLTDPAPGVGSLTARVFVNRLWYVFFGGGLARNVDDLGGQGEAPDHPELLDRLALEFVASGWDVKQLVKLLVTSRTYRQSSAASEGRRRRDPENRLFARQARYRLPAEAVRDAALAVSGLLCHDFGGVGIRPYQPEGYYRHLNFPQRTYVSQTDRRQWRRGVYMHWQRQFLHPMLKAMDAPSREECTAERPRSNTPAVALTLLNDPTFVEAARVFAARILRYGGESTASRLEYAFRRAVSRAPETIERQVLEELLALSRDEFSARPEAADALTRVGLAPPAAGFATLEVAAWTSVARAILNMNETLARN